MSRTKRRQAIRKMRGAGLRPGPFEAAYEGWNTARLRQAEAARVRGMCERRFRRYLSKYEAHGSEGLIDRRLDQASNRCAPVDEVMALSEPYPTRHSGGNVKHFHRGVPAFGREAQLHRGQKASATSQAGGQGRSASRSSETVGALRPAGHDDPPGGPHPRMGDRAEGGLDPHPGRGHPRTRLDVLRRRGNGGAGLGPSEVHARVS